MPFLERQIAVIGVDIRGHGRSSGMHGLLPTFQEIVSDIQVGHLSSPSML